MNVLRRVGLGIVGLILFTSLIAAAWADVAARTVRNRDTVKSWLTGSSFYNNITSAVLEGLQSVEGEQAGTIPADDPVLQEQVRGIFTADFLQDNIESLLDGTYNWLDGDVAKPDFVIDLSDAKIRLASALGQYAAQRADSLPACTLPLPDYDALNADCVPPGTTPELIASTVEAEFINNPEFLGDEVLTADNFHAPGEGQSATFFADPDTENIRRAYQFSGWAAPILFFLALLSAVAIVLLSSTRQAGLLRSGILILGSGVVLGITYLFMSQGPKILNKLANENLDPNRPATQALIRDFINVVSADIRGVMGVYALVFIAIGIVLITVSRFVGRDKTEAPKSKLIVEEASQPVVEEQSKLKVEASAPVKVGEPEKKQPPKIQL